MVSRRFSDAEGLNPPVRNVDNEAPVPMRREIVDLVFYLIEHVTTVIDEQRLYTIICQNLGIHATANPYGGYRYAAARGIGNVEWRAIYDLIERLWPEFQGNVAGPQYTTGINQILNAHGIVWELGDDGRLSRIVPDVTRTQINAALQELTDPRFAPAEPLLHSAIDAYNDRPRRDRDACSNSFDAMESVAKERYAMPRSTFGQVVAHIRQTNALNPQITELLSSLNTLRNSNFGHGMTTRFTFNSAEVDFTYITCIGAVLLFARLP
jgi:hypothetical protein